jgi:ADP-heptose:LPS heptosyltransferase
MILDIDTLRSYPAQKRVELVRSLQADCIIHVFPSREVAKLAKAAHIPLRVGTTSRPFHWFTCNKLVKLSRRKSPLHESQLNLMLAHPFGAKDVYAMEEVERLLSFTPPAAPPEVAVLCDSGKFNLVLHPKSNGSGREWSQANFAQLMALLPPERFKIFVTGTQREGSMVRSALIAPYAERVTDLTGKLSLEELIAFLSHADGIVAAGTGPLHIAAVLGIHAIGLFPPNRPIHPGRWAPVGKRVKVFVSSGESASRHQSGKPIYMQGIDPEEVAKYLKGMEKV